MWSGRFRRRNHGIRNAVWIGEALLVGLAVGAGLMYLADPDGGRQRRARIRAQTARLRRLARHKFEAAAREIRRRGKGLAVRLRTTFSDQPVPDSVLAERVLAEMGKGVSYPQAIELTVTDGVVTLWGPILASEIEDFVSRVKRVHGVSAVQSDLEFYETAEVPALRRSLERRGRWLGFLRSPWAPSTRLAVGATGLGLWAFGAGRRSPGGYALGSLGVLILASALTEPRRRRRDGTAKETEADYPRGESASEFPEPAIQS